MNFKVNMNGDTAETLIEGHLEVHRAADALITALNKMHPHGRNYQTCEDPIVAHTHDVNMNVEEINRVNHIRNDAAKNAMRAYKQKKGDFDD